MFEQKTEPMKINLQLFADSNEGDEGRDQNPNAGGDGGKKVEFSAEQQAEVDRIIAERLARASRTANKATLEAEAKAAGYESYAAMKEAAEAHRQAQEKQKTDLEREQEAKAAAEAKAEAAEQRAKTAFIKAAFAAHGATANLVNIDDAFKLADLSQASVQDDGTVEGVKEAIEQLIKDKPYLVKVAGTQQPQGGDPVRGNAETGAATRDKAAQIAAQRLGVKSGNDNQELATAVAVAVAQALASTNK